MHQRLIVFLLLTSLALVWSQDADLSEDVVAQVKDITRQLLLKKLEPSGRLLEPLEVLEMLKRCQELMPNGINEIEQLNSDQALVDWWLNLNNYIELSVTKPVKCKQGNFMPSLIKFICKRLPNMLSYVDHFKKLQDKQCSGSRF